MLVSGVQQWFDTCVHYKMTDLVTICLHQSYYSITDHISFTVYHILWLICFLFFLACLNLFIFNWNFTMLYSFCHTSTWTGISIFPPSWTSFPPPTPSHHSRLSESTGLSCLHHRANSHWLCGNIYTSVLLSKFIPISPSPCYDHKSILYVCVSIPALQMGSSVSVPFF